jgi:serine/threonine-protein kinase RsbW
VTVRELQLPSVIESVDAAALAVDKFARDHGFTDEHLFGIDLAVRESVANAVKHGNKFDEAKHVELKFSDTPDGMEVTVRDFGSGFTIDDVPDPTDPENILKCDGRGILFMRAYMDEVDWRNPADGGMEVRMQKKR